jgi:hypothetical protein
VGGLAARARLSERAPARARLPRRARGGGRTHKRREGGRSTTPRVDGEHHREHKQADLRPRPAARVTAPPRPSCAALARRGPTAAAAARAGRRQRAPLPCHRGGARPCLNPKRQRNGGGALGAACHAAATADAARSSAFSTSTRLRHRRFSAQPLHKCARWLLCRCAPWFLPCRRARPSAPGSCSSLGSKPSLGRIKTFSYSLMIFCSNGRGGVHHSPSASAICAQPPGVSGPGLAGARQKRGGRGGADRAVWGGLCTWAVTGDHSPHGRVAR